MEQLQEQLVEELRDLLDAEKQLTKALPKLARSVVTPELKTCFLEHLEVTKGQVARLEKVFELLGERAKGKPCKAMKGLVEESQEHLQEHERGEMLDNMLITAAQKVEHYEIAGYGTVRTIAKNLGQREVTGLLQETLREEEAADKKLTQVALQIQKQMMRGKPDVEEPPAKGASPSKKKVAPRSKQAAQGGQNTRAAATTSGRGAGTPKGSAKKSGGGSKAGSNVTVDHEAIKQWAEERGAHPACVRGTGDKGDIGILRLDFPGYTGADKLEEISWEDFFNKFDERGLALLYQESTARGQKSNFNKLITRENQ